MGDLNSIFNPKSVVFIGASDKEGSVNRAILENLFLYKGAKIFPVNPHRKELLGLTSYPALFNIPEPVELAVIATPATTVPELVEECGQAGVRGIIIISAGFKEIGEGGKRLETEIKEIRNKYGMRIMGPNCFGLIKIQFQF